MAPPMAMQVTGGLLGLYIVLSYFFHGNLYLPKYGKGRVVLLTDATSKLGKDVVMEYARMSAKLILVGTDHEKLQNISVEAVKAGADDATVIAADVTKRSDRLKLVSEAERVYGKLDYVILNHIHRLPLVKQPWNDTKILNSMMDTYLTSTVELVSRAFPVLLKTRGYLSVVLTIPGRAATQNLAAVSASQAAIEAYLASLRKQLKYSKSLVSMTSITLAYVKGYDNEVAQGRWSSFFGTSGSVETDDAAWWVAFYTGGRKKEVAYPFAAQCHSVINNWFPTIYEDVKMPDVKHFIQTLPTIGSYLK